jgi:APA family basic amino acid/polyamine antiporter
LAWPVLELQRIQPLFSGGIVGVLQATALLFFAYTGYARPVTLAEEIKEPQKTLPRAVAAAILITVVLYLAVAFAALGTLGPQDLGQESAPLRAVMQVTGNNLGLFLLSVGALIATFTVLLTEISGLSRLAFAMARNRDLPGWLSHLSNSKSIPRNAVLLAGGLLLVLTVTLDLRSALEASSLALLVYYGIMCLSALKLPVERRLYPSVIPAAGLAASTLVAFSLPWQTLVIVAGAIIAGLVFYWIFHRSKSR